MSELELFNELSDVDGRKLRVVPKEGDFVSVVLRKRVPYSSLEPFDQRADENSLIVDKNFPVLYREEIFFKVSKMQNGKIHLDFHNFFGNDKVLRRHISYTGNHYSVIDDRSRENLIRLEYTKRCAEFKEIKEFEKGFLLQKKEINRSFQKQEKDVKISELYSRYFKDRTALDEQLLDSYRSELEIHIPKKGETVFRRVKVEIDPRLTDPILFKSNSSLECTAKNLHYFPTAKYSCFPSNPVLPPADTDFLPLNREEWLNEWSETVFDERRLNHICEGNIVRCIFTYKKANFPHSIQYAHYAQILKKISDSEYLIHISDMHSHKDDPGVNHLKVVHKNHIIEVPSEWNPHLPEPEARVFQD